MSEVEIVVVISCNFCVRSPCDDHLSPSGTIERARQAVESASRSILANRAASVKKEKKEDDSVFVKNGSLKATKKGNNQADRLIFYLLCNLLRNGQKDPGSPSSRVEKALN